MLIRTSSQGLIHNMLQRQPVSLTSFTEFMELGLIVPVDMQSSEQKVSEVSYILATIMARE